MFSTSFYNGATPQVLKAVFDQLIDEVWELYDTNNQKRHYWTMSMAIERARKSGVNPRDIRILVDHVLEKPSAAEVVSDG